MKGYQKLKDLKKSKWKDSNFHFLFKHFNSQVSTKKKANVFWESEAALGIFPKQAKKLSENSRHAIFLFSFHFPTWEKRYFLPPLPRNAVREEVGLYLNSRNLEEVYVIFLICNILFSLQIGEMHAQFWVVLIKLSASILVSQSMEIVSITLRSMRLQLKSRCF